VLDAAADAEAEAGAADTEAGAADDAAAEGEAELVAVPLHPAIAITASAHTKHKATILVIF
jgi:predicted dinucleotide-binding enzyme